MSQVIAGCWSEATTESNTTRTVNYSNGQKAKDNEQFTSIFNPLLLVTFNKTIKNASKIGDRILSALLSEQAVGYLQAGQSRAGQTDAQNLTVRFSESHKKRKPPVLN